LKFQIFFYDTDLLHNIILEKDQTKKKQDKILAGMIKLGQFKKPNKAG